MALSMRPNQPKLLSNNRCAYCGETLTADLTTKEHVIGRRFVPRGSLQQSWNLILRACRDCNNIKSSLEDDIAAISLQPNAFGVHAAKGEAISEEARRRAEGSVSRLTGRAVGESFAQTSFAFNHMRIARGSVSLVAPPQIAQERLFELASYHLRAFFFLLTYDEHVGCGTHWPGVFMPLTASKRDDWGNSLQTSFQRRVFDWPFRLVHSNAATGWFKVALRRHPSELLWSWALEWNQNYRVLGFIGEEAQCARVAETLAPLEFREMRGSDGSVMRVRDERSLLASDDVMFLLPADQTSDDGAV